ncbi:MAG TPA: hotdog fold thioesterase [Flavobacteriales bacterium]|nr:hotdog fold thioesterase [Flavobacteriales bacterium]HRE97489.1 hotdog fold thioesterase [Flavobacteriales bacterium]HRJ36378.1 hotdog fold thioesterase [Flavobacteriales bacterium]HRJ37417.1 hotdog fold thioesterase [Flavobacteriales bacterium]
MLKQVPLEQLNAMNRNTIMEVLGIEYTELSPTTISGKMPVDHRTHQPVGLLHGGATAVLAETLGSMGSTLLIDTKEFAVTGVEVNANHLKGVKNGFVHATATILHAGRTTHVWNIEVKNDEQNLVAVCRLTVVVIPLKK